MLTKPRTRRRKPTKKQLAARERRLDTALSFFAIPRRRIAPA
ncbi:MAG TPA: hypothetical protein VJJ47_00265 [Candidatus Paceibacterota bacterium]